MNGVMDKGYSERDAALERIGAMLMMYGELASEYDMLTGPLNPNDGRSVSSFPNSVAVLFRSGYARQDESGIADNAAAKLRRAAGIDNIIRRDYLEGSSPLLPEDVEDLTRQLAALRGRLHRHQV